MHLLKLFSQPFQKYIIKFIISTEWRRSNGFLGTNSSAIGIGARQIEILHQLIECNQDEQWKLEKSPFYQIMHYNWTEAVLVFDVC